MATISETTKLLHSHHQEVAYIEDDIVGWDGDEDPANPLNWSPAQRWAHVAIVSLLTFLMYVDA